MTHASTPLVDDRFLLLELLGRGGMGRVYRAFDRLEERMVAIKLSRDGLTREFRAWSRLAHPNIVQAFELAVSRQGPLAPGTPYLVLESYAGLPAQRALPAGRASASELELLARSALCGLAHIHDAGLVHRDLKPANVLVDLRQGGVKLTDFGLAVESGNVGEPGKLSGSLMFVAPESLLARPLDGRADLYGLGVTLFLIATGRPPVPSREPARILEWHLNGPEADPLAHRPHLDPRLVRLIRGLLVRDREARPRCSRRALRLLGQSSIFVADGRRPPMAPGVGRDLRKALDAVRLGGWRRHRLPPSAGSAEVERRELANQCAIHDVTFLRIGGSDGRGETLARGVLRLLLKRGGPIRPLVRRHGLRRGLPLALFGGLPVWDRLRAPAEPSPEDLPAVARGVAGFIVEFARRHSLVLVFETAALAEPLVRAVVGELDAARRRWGNQPRPRGGLLLVLPARRRGPRPGRARPARLAAARITG